MSNNNGEAFRQTYTRIKGLSSIRRLPRIDKIRLGIKKISKKTGKEYPVETSYFVCPPEVRKMYGDEPTALNIMFPLNDPETLFPQAYKWYGSSAGLKCSGNGETALRINEQTNEMEERECPCELLDQGKCKQRASLVFMLPDVKIGGVYQIDLSSYHSIVDINSGLDYAMGLLGGRIAMVPFILRRTPRETHNEGQKQIHYTLTLEVDISLEQARKIREGNNVFSLQHKQYEIEPPMPDKNPALETKEHGAVIETTDQEESEEGPLEDEDLNGDLGNEFATTKQMELIENHIVKSHLMTATEKKRLYKKIDDGITKQEASKIIEWWISDSKTEKQGERSIREKQGNLEEEGNADFEPEMFETEKAKH